jgi:uncharacterized protein (DUF1499 family)
MTKASRVAMQVAAAGLFLALGLVGLVLLMAPAMPAPFGPWQRVSQILDGPQDLGPVDFARLAPRLGDALRPGDALLCPPDLCPGAAATAAPPVFTISAERLAAKLRRYALREVGVEELPAAGADHLRFVRRSLILRLPDVIDARILPRSSGASTVALYSRPVVGGLDFGANRARMERWMEALSQ